MLLALTSYPANAYDLLETGLVTHFVESGASLGGLERTLAEMRPWNQQGLLREPVRYYGHDGSSSGDHNAVFRNVQVADAVECVSAARADNRDLWGHGNNNNTMDDDDVLRLNLEDPSLETEYVPWNEPRESRLINLACTFHSLISSASNVEGLLENFRQVAHRTTTDPEEQEGIDVAKDMVASMEQQSPLALKVVYQLLLRGAGDRETLAKCCAREERAQLALLRQPDFALWATHCQTNGEKEYHGPWKYGSLKEVPNDLVAEIIGDD